MAPRKLTLSLLTAALLASGCVMGDDDRGWFGGWRRDVAPARDPAYLAECGSCHFAYPPALLPARSWTAVMDGLADHFGENAELPADTATALTDYLLANAADYSNSKRARGIVASIGLDAPLRITDTAYFRRKHDELGSQMVEANPQVGSYSRCEACHTRAAEGSFNEHEVRIPGYGRWED
jgi:hypothetical protein